MEKILPPSRSNLSGLSPADVVRRAPAAVHLRGDDARRQQLIDVAIDCLAEGGLAGGTLAQIAGRAGVSPGLIAHYFGDKDGLLEAAFRRLSSRVHAAVRAHTLRAHTPRERVLAIVEAHLAPEEFNRRTANAWLAFWGGVLHVNCLRRVQRAYQRRMLSNLRHALSQCLPMDNSRQLAAMIAAMIDGIWLRAALSDWQEADSTAARKLLNEFIHERLDERLSTH
jgi:betaine-aldehyde dehydrogenase